MEELDVFAWRVAKYYEKDIPCRSSSTEKPAVVALLGPSNIEYLVTLLALSKLGHTVLLLSTRIPQPAVENLLTRTEGTVLVYESRFSELASRVQGSMSVRLLELAGRPVFEFPVEMRGDTRLDYNLDPEIEKDNISFIIHSSGKFSEMLRPAF
jgi:acyl-CoA synthetase (AMP-forming)/AMP-acid ligase II